MSSPRSTLRDALFTSVLSFAATYTPPGGGTAIPCRVLFGDKDSSEAFGSPGAIVRETRISVRMSEVAAPAKDGVFTLTDGSTAYAIASTPLFDRGFGTVMCPVRQQ